MPKRTMLSVLAVAAVLPAAATLTAGANPAAPAADECLAKPKAVAPQGSHWYYRLERKTKRQCWYLGAEGAKVSRAESPRAAPLAKPAVPPVAEMPTETNAREREPAQTFFTRWSDMPNSIGSNVAEPASPSSGYADEQPAADMASQDDMPLVWPILSPGERPAIEPPRLSAAESEHALAFVVCALALAATIAFTIFKLGAARRPRRPQHGERWDAGWAPPQTRAPRPGPRLDEAVPAFLLRRRAA